MKLLWCDVETSGLDPSRCAILEVAAYVADLEKPFEVRPVFDAPLAFMRHEANKVGLQDGRWFHYDDFIETMHTKNGLFYDCLGSTYYSPREVQEQLLVHVPLTDDRDEKVLLAGSTVHFDRSFLAVYMPELVARLGHRHYDVSAVKLFCQSLGMPKFAKAEAHRAAADVLESVAHARDCFLWLRKNVGELHFLGNRKDLTVRDPG